MGRGMGAWELAKGVWGSVRWREGGKGGGERRAEMRLGGRREGGREGGRKDGRTDGEMGGGGVRAAWFGG